VTRYKEENESKIFQKCSNQRFPGKDVLKRSLNVYSRRNEGNVKLVHFWTSFAKYRATAIHPPNLRWKDSLETGFHE